MCRASCDISRPETATPPALAALPGPYRIPAATNCSTPSGVVGMFEPSATTNTPPFSRFAASLALISFCVALGNAQSAGMAHRGQASSIGSCGMYVAFG